MESLNKRRRETTEQLIEWIQKAKEKITKAKERIKEINKELSEAKEHLDNLRAEFLELSDEQQLDKVVDIEQAEGRVNSLTNEKTSLEKTIFGNNHNIEGWLERLDELRQKEYEAREQLAYKKEAQIAQSQGHNAVVKLIERRFIRPLEEWDKFTVEELKDNPKVIAAIEQWFHNYGLPFPSKAMKVFPGSETKDFPKDLFESVRGKLNAVKALKG